MVHDILSVTLKTIKDHTIYVAQGILIIKNPDISNQEV